MLPDKLSCVILTLLHALLLPLNKCSFETQYKLHSKKKKKKRMYKCMYIHFGGISHSSIIKTKLNFAWKEGIHLTSIFFKSNVSLKALALQSCGISSYESQGFSWPIIYFHFIKIFSLIFSRHPNKEKDFLTKQWSSFICLYQKSFFNYMDQ